MFQNNVVSVTTDSTIKTFDKKKLKNTRCRKDMQLGRAVFTAESLDIQEKIQQLQGHDNIFVCGSYVTEV